VLGLGLLSGLCWADGDADEDKAKKNDKENYGTVIGIDLGTTYSWYCSKYILECSWSHGTVFWEGVKRGEWHFLCGIDSIVN